MRRLIASLCCCFVIGVQAEVFNAKVVVVMDGDTVLVQSGGLKAKVRLVNIDAPEKDQPYGKESRESLLTLIGGKTVQIESKAVDQYGRTIALLSIDGINVNEEQVRQGMAWAYSRSRDSRHYAALQREAQQARRGLWQQRTPQHPSQWRKTHPSEPSVKHQKTVKKQILQTEEASKFSALACGKKHYCSQMVTCDEAHFYLTVCGLTRLDTNKDGIPCESLCGVLE